MFMIQIVKSLSWLICGQMALLTKMWDMTTFQTKAIFEILEDPGIRLTVELGPYNSWAPELQIMIQNHEMTILRESSFQNIYHRS